MSGELRLSVFGRPRVEVAGATAEPVSAKALALLVYLVLTGVPHGRSALAGLFWGGLPEEQARANLRQALTRLRKAVGAHVLIDHASVAWNRELPHQIDALTFDALWDEVDRHRHRHAERCSVCAGHLRQLAALYTHQLLADVALEDSAEFELWLASRRAVYHGRALAAMAALSEAEALREDYAAAERWARRQIELDPLGEPAYRQLMRALALSGQRGLALAQYQACAHMLDDEFGTEPEPATVALREQIARGHLVAPLPPPVRGLPAPLTPCIGRAALLRDLGALLTSGEVRLLTLTGPGGVGKTRLAIAAAGELAHQFDHGVAYIALAPLHEEPLALEAISQVLELAPQHHQRLLDRLVEALRDRELLLVLDNLEHLLGATPAIAELLARCPQLTVLATSREPLQLRGEHCLAVPPLGVPAAETLERLPAATLARADSVQLFVALARASNPGLVLDDAALRAVAAVCVRLDGLPLAIELAAGQVARLPLVALRAQIETSAGLPLLGAGARDLPERQRTLRATIAWSYDLLTPEAQHTLRWLAVFVGGFTAPLAQAVLAPAAPSTATLEALVAKQLIRPSDEAGRYTYLETIRAFALEQLDATGEAYAAYQRHAQQMIALAGRAEPELLGADPQPWLERLEHEHNNLRAALGWLLEADETDLAVGLAAALWRFWEIRGYLSEGSRWLALTSTRGRDPERRAKALNALGVFAFRQGAFEAATAALQESLQLRRELGALPGIAVALSNLGMLAWGHGDYATAHRYYRECLPIDEATGDQQGRAYTLGNLGLALHHQGETDAACVVFGEVVALSRTLGDVRNEAFALHNLGMAELQRGGLEAALDCFERSLRIKETMGDRWAVASTLVYLARVRLRQNDGATGRKLLRRSLELQTELDDRPGLVETLEGIAAASGGADTRAARLFGAAAALRARLRLFHHEMDRAAHEQAVAEARARLGEESFRRAAQAGELLSFEECLRLGRSLVEQE